MLWSRLFIPTVRRSRLRPSFSHQCCFGLVTSGLWGLAWILTCRGPAVPLNKSRQSSARMMPVGGQESTAPAADSAEVWQEVPGAGN